MHSINWKTLQFNCWCIDASHNRNTINGQENGKERCWSYGNYFLFIFLRNLKNSIRKISLYRTFDTCSCSAQTSRGEFQVIASSDVILDLLVTWLNIHLTCWMKLKILESQFRFYFFALPVLRKMENKDQLKVSMRKSKKNEEIHYSG